MPDDRPPDLEAYRTTPVFDADTIPAGLLRRHSTKAGVWARIHVLEGELVFRRLEPGAADEILRAGGSDRLVEPQAFHEVEARGPVRFFIEFLRPRSDGAPTSP
jgi:tellurite resistance-related uncharacterized protein